MSEASTKPLKRSYGELSDVERSQLSDTYKLLVEMADKVSQRRQSANNFYLSVNAAIVGATSYISLSSESLANTAVVALGGIAVAFLWRRNIISYRDLNAGKFCVITEIEKELPFAPYSAEWEYLKRGEDNSRYRPFHTVEGLVPFVFMALHFIQILGMFPWCKFAEL